ncbi:KPN_02809 family neutral zinc metallopeptidase [Arachnia rubra]|jgi:hypothetical protein|uniref:Neutral zinc metallopeptidase n=1 Tax=Arachnia rubra TaxID=1547448 RepID=A0ABX7Y6S0_9ACTN|nr:neutral zinc metallopeptidase [Arachnia rubra]MDO4645652.1 neutral zinc metallopeptidase [Propionibacteriaceae bacterium]QUC08746.1 neutral zinc metallopeptidase [Arachnia rubra]BCR80167.1 membrane protein [Arachnia rubra]
MDYRDSVDLSDSHIQRGSGGGGRGGRMALGGGVGGVVLMLLVVFVGPSLGINVSDLLGSGGSQNTQGAAGQGDSLEHCRQKDVNVNTNRECRWALYDKVVQDYWSKAKSNYSYGTMKLFSGTTSTACGVGQTEMGPFYCSGDSTVYIDDSYVGQLLKQLGASGGDAAELYIVAHEYGHHIQNLDGTMRSVRRGTGADSQQVRLELQADCYSGVVFNQIMKDSSSPIKTVSKDDLLRIADAARSVGDDHIQKQQGGFVNPESWTHGSSEQRQRWLSTGFDSGDPASCNTFDTQDL